MDRWRPQVEIECRDRRMRVGHGGQWQVGGWGQSPSGTRNLGSRGLFITNTSLGGLNSE